MYCFFQRSICSCPCTQAICFRAAAAYRSQCRLVWAFGLTEPNRSVLRFFSKLRFSRNENRSVPRKSENRAIRFRFFSVSVPVPTERTERRRRRSLGGVRRRRASSPTGRRGVRRHRASPPAVHPPLQGTRDGWSRRRTGREGGGRGRGRAPPRRDSEREGGRLGRGGAPPAAAPRGRETGPGQGRHRAGREEDGAGQGAAAPGLRGGGKLPCRDEGGAGRGGWDWGGALVRAL